MTTSAAQVESRKQSVRAAFPSADLDTSPIVFSKCALRFELGAPHRNASDERVAQSFDRASQVFGDLFDSTRELILIIDDWESSGHKLVSSVPLRHLDSLISGFDRDSAPRELLEYDEVRRHRYWLRCEPAAVDYRRILLAIANSEQGRTPRIGKSLYFVDCEQPAAFFMYDDRGCLAYFGDRDASQRHYEKRRAWVIKRRLPLSLPNNVVNPSGGSVGF